MPCKICGSPHTVKSHIFPKAVVREIRGEWGHVVTGSRFHKGAKPSPAGIFSKTILCAKHEAKTSDADKYGTEFIRRATEAYHQSKASSSFDVVNSTPQQLSRFVLSVVWRDSKSSENRTSDSRMGPYEREIADIVFNHAECRWPLMVVRERFTIGGKLSREVGIHPRRCRIIDRSAWSFSIAGYTFYIVLDKRGFPALPVKYRADLSDPVKVIVSDPIELRNIKPLREIYSNMSSKIGRLP